MKLHPEVKVNPQLQDITHRQALGLEVVAESENGFDLLQDDLSVLLEDPVDTPVNHHRMPTIIGRESHGLLFAIARAIPGLTRLIVCVNGTPDVVPDVHQR